MSKKGKSNNGSVTSKQSLTEQVVATLTKSGDQAFNYKQIAKRINVTDTPGKQMVSDILRDLSERCGTS